ncbi:hypothetical protein CRE_01549 [Caenorhabditis remanei]|uniref:F-box domain-containing protein n=1 Tax=Caenorhabditis remanei TaxID=31234 RepID=E3LGE1_CAERE|nr:hypothetical protein CRE_01549 [Caenorhabditis remanei]
MPRHISIHKETTHWEEQQVPLLHPAYSNRFFNLLIEMSSLPILKLPDSAADLVVKLLNFSEKIKLCICSKRSAKIVERGQQKIQKINIHMNETWCTIWVVETLFSIDMNEFKVRFSNNIPRLLKFSDNELYCKVLNPVQENMNLAKRILATFVVDECRYTICVREKKSENLKKYIKRVVPENYSDIFFEGKQHWEGNTDFLDTDEVSFILETVKPEARLTIDSTISLDFKHDNPFNFKSVCYSDGRWVTMDVLKSIKHSETICLEHTNFSCKDINEYIHHWVNSREDLIRNLGIGIKGDLEFNEQELLDKLAFATCQRQYWKYYFIKAKSVENRKFTFALISYNSNLRKVEIETDEPDVGLAAVIFKHLEDIVEIQKLSEVREKIVELEMKCVEVLEEETPDTEKERIRKELEIVVKTRNLIETRLDGIRSQWKDFLKNIYSGLLRVAGTTDTTLRVTVTSPSHV